MCLLRREHHVRCLDISNTCYYCCSLYLPLVVFTYLHFGELSSIVILQGQQIGGGATTPPPPLR